MYTESVFHHQSYEILKDLEPYMRDLTGTQCNHTMYRDYVIFILGC